MQSRAEAEEYLEKHNIRQLFEELTAALLIEKPEDPAAFLAARLRKVHGKTKTALFTNDDLRAVFSSFDPTGRGQLQPSQVETALYSVGLRTLPPMPSGPITEDKFVALASAALASATLV